MNLLVTAIGSMASEVTLKTLRGLYPDKKIIVTDIYPREWIWQASLADVFYRVPKATEKDYDSAIFELCLKNSVEFVIPLIDPEVDVLSRHHQKFNNAGITICTSTKKTIDTCRDKLNLYNKFKSNGSSHVIPTYTDMESALQEKVFPFFGKPRRGRSSEGILRIPDKSVLKNPVINSGNYIFQPFMHGNIYTVDVVRDAFGNCTCVARKELIRNKIGAGITVEILNHSRLEETAAKVAASLDILGAVNIEFICSDEIFYLMDVNPRFSAGIHFTVLSGYDIVKNHMRAFQNLEIEPKPVLKEGIYYKNYQTFVL